MSELDRNKARILSYDSTPIQVISRVRPLLRKEAEQGQEPCVAVRDKQHIQIGDQHILQFDRVLGGDTVQATLYQQCVAPLIDGLFSGYNASVLAYGQTGSGKTYTMGSDWLVEEEEYDEEDEEDDYAGFNTNEGNLSRAAASADRMDGADQSDTHINRRAISAESDYDLPSNTGILPRAFQHVAASVHQLVKSSINNSFNSKQESSVPIFESLKLSVSFFEVYQETIRDLLHPTVSSKKIAVFDGKDGAVHIRGAPNEVVVEWSLRRSRESNDKNLIESLPRKRQIAKELLRLLNIGVRHRTTGSTNMNDSSSRSHAIFTLSIDGIVTQTDGDSTKKRIERRELTSQLRLVDLAGSERAKRTRASGTRFAESVQINQGLLALGNVIAALAESSKIPNKESSDSQADPVDSANNILRTKSGRSVNSKYGAIKTNNGISSKFSTPPQSAQTRQRAIPVRSTADSKNRNKVPPTSSRRAHSAAPPRRTTARSVSQMSTESEQPSSLIRRMGRGAGLHIPYRDSKLTRLLQDSLGGNSRTCFIACISPCESDFHESRNTLRYAERARSIRNKPTVGLKPINMRSHAIEQVEQLTGKRHPKQLELTRAKLNAMRRPSFLLHDMFRMGPWFRQTWTSIQLLEDVLEFVVGIGQAGASKGKKSAKCNVHKSTSTLSRPDKHEPDSRNISRLASLLFPGAHNGALTLQTLMQDSHAILTAIHERKQAQPARLRPHRSASAHGRLIYFSSSSYDSQAAQDDYSISELYEIPPNTSAADTTEKNTDGRIHELFAKLQLMERKYQQEKEIRMQAELHVRDLNAEKQRLSLQLVHGRQETQLLRAEMEEQQARLRKLEQSVFERERENELLRSALSAAESSYLRVIHSEVDEDGSENGTQEHKEEYTSTASSPDIKNTRRPTSSHPTPLQSNEPPVIDDDLQKSIEAAVAAEARTRRTTHEMLEQLRQDYAKLQIERSELKTRVEELQVHQQRTTDQHNDEGKRLLALVTKLSNAITSKQKTIDELLAKQNESSQRVHTLENEVKHLQTKLEDLQETKSAQSEESPRTLLDISMEPGHSQTSGRRSSIEKIENELAAATQRLQKARDEEMETGSFEGTPEEEYSQLLSLKRQLVDLESERNQIQLRLASWSSAAAADVHQSDRSISSRDRPTSEGRSGSLSARSNVSSTINPKEKTADAKQLWSHVLKQMKMCIRASRPDDRPQRLVHQLRQVQYRISTTSNEMTKLATSANLNNMEQLLDLSADEDEYSLSRSQHPGLLLKLQDDVDALREEEQYLYQKLRKLQVNPDDTEESLEPSEPKDLGQDKAFLKVIAQLVGNLPVDTLRYVLFQSCVEVARGFEELRILRHQRGAPTQPQRGSNTSDQKLTRAPWKNEDDSTIRHSSQNSHKLLISPKALREDVPA